MQPLRLITATTPQTTTRRPRPPARPLPEIVELGPRENSTQGRWCCPMCGQPAGAWKLTERLILHAVRGVRPCRLRWGL
jgi:hypothetical protein